MSLLNFRLEDTPGTNEPVDIPNYPIKAITQVDEHGNEYTDHAPEIDFRALESTLTKTDILTHAIHKHPAIFIPQIPRHIIRTYTTELNAEGKRPVVMDPFNGSGTTGVESKIAGRDYLGVEINPLSKLVSEVATTPIPYNVLKNVRSDIIDRLDECPTEYYEDYDVEFLDQTGKHHWFEDQAIDGLTTIRKVITEYLRSDHDWQRGLEVRERKAISDLGLTDEDLNERVSRWLVLMIANTVFEVSNADPGVSKAHKSKRMREKIDNGEHPPDAITEYKKHLKKSEARLIDLWNEVYRTNAPGGTDDRTTVVVNDAENSTLHRFSNEWVELEENNAHQATTDIKLADARSFSFPKYKNGVDLAITSPPYINAMNYFRGTKLRIFWIHDLIEEITNLDATKLRKSIIGTNSVSISDVDRELPVLLRDEWKGTEAEYDATSLPMLDTHIEEIHGGDLTEATSRAYTTWKFFAEDMLKSLTRVYEHLKPGGLFFFIVGENTISGRRIQNHRFIADIAQNLGKFKTQDGHLQEDEGYNLVEMGWDKITNRDLFQGRSHGYGVIEHEWVVILQKPGE